MLPSLSRGVFIFCVSLRFFVEGQAYAATYTGISSGSRYGTRSAKRFFIETGVISQNLGRFATKPSGTTSLSSAHYLDIALSAQFPISPRLAISPLIGYTPFGYKSADENEKSYLMPIAVRAVFHFEHAYVHIGPGLLIYSISGSGGTATLNNGTSTAVFGLPSESHSSKLVMLDTGVGVSQWNFRVGMDVLITGLMSSDKRAYNALLNLGYGFF